MSTVRSSTDYLNYDIKHTLGFVANSRRLNGTLCAKIMGIHLDRFSHFVVAITRAQALLIIVGNPVVLSLDPLWRALLNYIHAGGGWKGKGIEWDPTEPILPDGYARKIRDHAEGEAINMISSLKSLIAENTEDLSFADDISDSGSDGEGYMDNGVWREEE
jgi:helicase MOV-10